MVTVRDKRRLPFIMVTKAALAAIRDEFDSRRGQAALAIYVAVVECANDARSETFETPRKVIADRAMVHERILDKYVPELERIGLLHVHRRPEAGLPNEWTLTDPEQAGAVILDAPPPAEGGCHSGCAPPVHPESGGGGHSESTPPLNREEEHSKKPKKTATPSPSAQSSEVDQVFDEWVLATNRDPGRTKLTPDRQRVIRLALKSHGLDVCIAAVRNIGADRWAAGENDRHRPFNDISHALGGSKRIEDWSTRGPHVPGQKIDGPRIDFRRTPAAPAAPVDVDVAEQWRQLGEQLLLVVDELTFNLWLAPLAPSRGDAGELVLGAGDRARWVDGRFGRVIAEAAGPLGVTVRVSDDPALAVGRAA